MNIKYKSYIAVIVLIKISYTILEFIHLYLEDKGKTNSDIDAKIVYWKVRVEFVFNILIAILLIFLFNPYRDEVVLIDRETKMLLFLFGIILFISAKWSEFIEKPVWLQTLQEIVGKAK
jgi:hypothetical protein